MTTSDSGESTPRNARERPLVTFALFAYNQEKYIREAVAGALAQTYEPLEIILSDDCSKDRTFDIMREMAESYRGPHTIRLNRNEPNLGIGGHVNKVFGMASGELVVVAAGDDISAPERTEVTSKAWLERGRPSVILAGVHVIDDQGRPREARVADLDGIRANLARPVDKVVEAWSRMPPRMAHHLPPGCSAAYTPVLFQRFGPIPPNILNEDEILLFRGALLGSVLVLEEPLVKYRTHDSNLYMRNAAASAGDHATAMATEKWRSTHMARGAVCFDAHVTDIDRLGADSGVSAASRRAMMRTARIQHAMANWWSIGWLERVSVVFRLLARGNLRTAGTLIPRLLPLAVFLAWKSRASRRSG